MVGAQQKLDQILSRACICEAAAEADHVAIEGGARRSVIFAGEAIGGRS